MVPLDDGHVRETGSDLGPNLRTTRSTNTGFAYRLQTRAVSAGVARF